MKRFLLPLLIIIGGFGLAALLIATGPKLESRPPVINAPLVRVLSVDPQRIQLTTSTHGTVAPRTQSQLVAEVSGRIITMSPSMVSGGFFRKGDILFSIDPLDYDVALEQARANLTRAESDFSNARKTHARQQDLEKKQSISASQMDDALNRLRIAEATLRESKAKLARAQRDLDRTQLAAPYDGRVRSEQIDVGQFVSRGTPLAMLYATDIAEVKLPIHDEELAFLDLPLGVNGTTLEKRIPVTLRARFAGAEHQWPAEVVRTEGELDPRTRMINVIAQVNLPYVTVNNKPPLSVGLFVKAEIKGIHVDDVVIVPRAALRANSEVLIVDTDNRLRFRSVEVLRITENKVYINSGLVAGERLCVSPLNSPVEGMQVRLEDVDSAAQVAGS